MNYGIVWDIEAYHKLRQIWDKTADIDRVTYAFDEIERRLSITPETEGESRAAVAEFY